MLSECVGALLFRHMWSLHIIWGFMCLLVLFCEYNIFLSPASWFLEDMFVERSKCDVFGVCQYGMLIVCLAKRCLEIKYICFWSSIKAGILFLVIDKCVYFLFPASKYVLVNKLLIHRNSGHMCGCYVFGFV